MQICNPNSCTYRLECSPLGLLQLGADLPPSLSPAAVLSPSLLLPPIPPPSLLLGYHLEI